MRISKALPFFTGIQGDRFDLNKPTTIQRAQLEQDIPNIHAGMERATKDSEEDITLPISEWVALNAFVSKTVNQITFHEAHGGDSTSDTEEIKEYIEHMGPGPLMELYGYIWVSLWASDYGVTLNELGGEDV